MTIDEIIHRHEELEHELKSSLAKMERSDRILEIRKQILENQKQCPHFSNKYNWTVAYGKCPYCGFILDSRGDD